MADSHDEDRLDVVAVAPHPDDVEILCGGTLAKLVGQGYRVGVIDLTTGEPTPRGTEEVRAAESEKARQILGVQVRINLGLPNRELMDCPAARYPLATEFRRHRPHIVISMAGRTPAASPDHHQSHLIIEAARFYSQLTKWDDRFDDTPPYRVPHLVYAPAPFDAEQRTWHGQFVVDISDTFEQKMQAIAAYESQFDEKRLAQVRHWIGSYNGMLGGRSGFLFGEFFTLPQPVGTEDLVRLIRIGRSSPAPAQIPGRDHLPQG